MASGNVGNVYWRLIALLVPLQPGRLDSAVLKALAESLGMPQYMLSPNQGVFVHEQAPD